MKEQVTFAELAPQYDVMRGVTQMKNGRKDIVLVSYVKTRAGEIERSMDLQPQALGRVEAEGHSVTVG